MSGIAEFLLARIAEDEEWARLSASPDYSDGEPGTPGHSTRVLAECEAKRQLVKLHSETDHREDRLVLSILALPYADHEGFREEWKP